MIDEKLSAFLDGEAGKEEILELLRRFEKEPSLRAMLDRYHYVQACMRGESHLHLGSGFAERVMAGIAAEETAPVRHATPTRQPTRRHLRTLVGLAMAASVAGFAILALQSFPLHDSATSPQIAENAPTTTVPLAVADADAGQSVRWEQLPADAAEQLNGYLISHNNYATDHGLGGPLGFMRVATYDNGEDMQSDR